MNTKTSILTALVALASGTGAMAQVYSQNVVGYVNVPVSSGFTLIANPLNTSDNTLGALIPAPPEFTTVYKWNDVTDNFEIATFFLGAWDNTGLSLNPGEGVFYSPGDTTASTLTFVGEVLQGAQSNPIPSGLSIRSSKVPQSGTLTVLEYPTPGEFDTVYRWNTSIQNYDIYSYFLGAWSPEEPSLNVGEAMFIDNANSATSWNRTFNVN